MRAAVSVMIFSLSLCAGCGGASRVEAVRRLSDRLENFGGRASAAPSVAPASLDRAEVYLSEAEEAVGEGDSLAARRFAHLGLIQLDIAVVLAEQLALEDLLEKRSAASALLVERKRALEERLEASADKRGGAEPEVPAAQPFVCPAREVQKL